MGQLSDTTIGVLLTIPVIVTLIVAAKILGHVTHSRFKKAMSPLLPAINGTLTKSGVGGLMFGTFRGREVGVSSTENSRSSEYPGPPVQKRNRWMVEMKTKPGMHDWSYTHRGFSSRSGLLDRTNSTPRKQLEELLNQFGNNIVVHFHARSGRLTFEEDLMPALAPSPSHFSRELELMEKLARVSEELT